MPMHDVGYRKWEGELTSSLARWWMIVSTGFSIAFRSHWLRRMMLAAWVPVFVFGVLIFVVEEHFAKRQLEIEQLTLIADKAGLDLNDQQTVKALINTYVDLKGLDANGSGSDQTRANTVQRIKLALKAKNVDLDKPDLAEFTKIVDYPAALALIPASKLIDLASRLSSASPTRAKSLLIDFANDLKSDPEFQRKYSELFEAVQSIPEQLASRDPATKQLFENLGQLESQESNMLLQGAFVQLNRERWNRDIGPVPYRKQIIAALAAPNNSEGRELSWSYFLAAFLGNTQGLATVILIALIVPPLISRDLRSRAYFIYFAKPIGRVEYLLGKFAIPTVFLCLVTTLPAVGLFMFAIAMSPDLSVVKDTWHLPIRIVLASAIMIFPTVSLALMLSSLTQESRFATFSWFAIWALSTGAYYVMNLIKIVNEREVLSSNWRMISLYDNVCNIQSWIFGLAPWNASVAGGLILLTALTAISWVVLYQRVSAPIRI